MIRRVPQHFLVHIDRVAGTKRLLGWLLVIISRCTSDCSITTRARIVVGSLHRCLLWSSNSCSCDHCLLLLQKQSRLLLKLLLLLLLNKMLLLLLLEQSLLLRLGVRLRNWFLLFLFFLISLIVIGRLLLLIWRIIWRNLLRRLKWGGNRRLHPTRRLLRRLWWGRVSYLIILLTLMFLLNSLILLRLLDRLTLWNMSWRPGLIMCLCWNTAGSCSYCCVYIYTCTSWSRSCIT